MGLKRNLCQAISEFDMSAGYDAVWRNGGEASSNSALTERVKGVRAHIVRIRVVRAPPFPLSFALHFLLRIFPLERAGEQSFNIFAERTKARARPRGVHSEAQKVSSGFEPTCIEFPISTLLRMDTITL